MKSKTNLGVICLTGLLGMGAAGADYIFAQNDSSNSSSALTPTPTFDKSRMAYDPDITPTSGISTPITPGVVPMTTSAVSPTLTPAE